MSKQTVYDRDGGECWYCGTPLTFEEATHEHILANTHGGTNGDFNTTIACKPCNIEAGALAIVDKVRLRETKRGQLTKKLTTLTIGDIRVEVRQQ